MPNLLARWKVFCNLRRSQRLAHKKRYDEAIDTLQKTRQQYAQQSPAVDWHLGWLLCQQNKTSEALVVMQDVATSHPIGALYMAKILIETGQYPQAIPHLKRSLELDPENQLTSSYLALAHLGSGNRQEFLAIVKDKGLSENSELQIRIILLLEKILREQTHEPQN